MSTRSDFIEPMPTIITFMPRANAAGYFHNPGGAGYLSALRLTFPVAG
jgi:hypothetical protein